MVGNDRVVTGYYSYIGPDGKTYTVNYIADRNGYRATGSHLPGQSLPPPQGPYSTPGPPIESSTPFPPSPYPPSSTPAPPYYSPSPFIPSSTQPPPYYSSSTAPPFSPSPSPFPSSQPGYYPQRPNYSPFPTYVPSSTIAPPPYTPSSTELIPSIRPPFPPPPSPSYIPPPTATRFPIRPPPSSYVPSATYIPSTTTPFPIYTGPTPPWEGYVYQNPYARRDRDPAPFSRSPDPIYYSTPTPPSFSSSSSPSFPITRLSFAAQRPGPALPVPSTTLAPPPPEGDFISSTQAPNHFYQQSAFNNRPGIVSSTQAPNHFYQQSAFNDGPGIISSTPRPFSVVPAEYSLQPDTVYITPKTFINQPREPLSNSLAINRELLPPLVNVNTLDNRNYRRSSNENEYASNHNYGNSLGVRPLASSTSTPQTVKDFSYRSSNYKK